MEKEDDFSALKDAPIWIKSLAKHAQPTAPVTGFQLSDDASVTFKREDDTIVVADLKTRQIVDRGEGVAFPEKLKLCIINPAEYDAENAVFHAGSNSANTILRFAQAVFDRNSRSAPRLPEPETANVKLKKKNKESCYIVALPEVCSLDGGNFKLEIQQTKAIIRCNGKQCNAKGKRWIRPQRSTEWSLSFLFANGGDEGESRESDAKKAKKNKDEGGYPPPPPGWGYMLVKLQ